MPGSYAGCYLFCNISRLFRGVTLQFSLRPTRELLVIATLRWNMVANVAIMLVLSYGMHANCNVSRLKRGVTLQFLLRPTRELFEIATLRGSIRANVAN